MINTLFTKMRSDIKLTSTDSDGTNDLTYLLAEWNRYSDVNQRNTYQQNCKITIQDYWAQTTEQCPLDYKPLPNNSPMVSEKSCLLFTDWTYQTTALRYSSSPEGCKEPESFISVNAALMQFFSKIEYYARENDKLLIILIEDMKGIDSNFANASDKLLQYLNGINAVIDPLVSIYSDSVGNQKLFEFINCSKIIFNKTSLESI